MVYKDNNSNHPKVDEPCSRAEEAFTGPSAHYVDKSSIGSKRLIEASSQVFDSMVTRDYLHALSCCQVQPMQETNYSAVRWYRIDKIVLEKKVFFADKLSMLYMSLHKKAKNVILVLNKQKDGDIELYLGARDFSGSSHVSGEILEAGLEGYFPGIGYKMQAISALNFEHPAVASVSAIASLRDDKKEDFVQGIERLINATSAIPRFRTYFVADSVSNSEAKEMVDAFNNLYTRLSPAETLQLTYNESESKSVSESFTENFSKSIGESISKTVTHTDGYSENTTEGRTKTDGTSENYSRNIIVSVWNGLTGGKTGRGSSHSESTSSSSSIGNNFSDSEANQRGANTTEQKGESTQSGTSQSTTTGMTEQVTYKNRTAKYYLDILDRQLERLQKGNPFGLWSVATYFVANDATTAQQLANIYRGSIIGEESGLETCAINVWQDSNVVKDIFKYLSKSLNPRFDYCSLDVSAGSIVTSKELAIHLSLPQSSVPGIIVEERASFARNVISEKEPKEKIEIGHITHLGKESDTPVSLNLEELTKHTFVTGSTGSGKSNVMYLMLQQIREKGKHFMVIEPAKGEYKHVFGCLKDVTVYSNTHKVGELLRINPFSFPYEYIEVLEHVDSLVEIFNACWPMYAAMPAVLKHSVITAYEKCGWDIETSEHKLSTPLFPTIEDVLVCLSEYIDNSNYAADTKGDYKGALEVRLQELCEGVFGKMLNSESISDEKLFNENVIVDLSRVKSTETKALLMGFLVMKLNEFRMSEGGMNKPLQHVTVLEEAHNLLKKTSSEQSQESSNLAGKSVEMISNSIAEMRTYGEAFVIVDQSPTMLDASAIRNTNTKIVLALPAIEDRKAAGASMSLKDEQIEEIGRLKQGEAIVYQNVWEEPVQCKISKFTEFESDFYYNKTSKPSPKQGNKRSADVVKFLLAPYIKEPFDVEKIREHLSATALPTSVKYGLSEMLLEYEDKGNLSIWDDYKIAKLSEVVKSYLHLEAEYRNMTEQHSNMNQLRVLLDNLLRDKIEGDLSIEVLYYTERCFVRNNAMFEQWRDTFRVR
jgi:putative ATP-binding protein